MYQNIKTHRSNFSGSGNGFRSRKSSFGRARVKTIDPALFVKKAVDLPVETAPVSTCTFADFKLTTALNERLVRRGYTKPTPIQEHAIPKVMAGSDVIGIANTGTGKTAAFLLPLLHKTLTAGREKTLVIVPTRELAVQIEDELRAFSQGLPIYSALCIGGASFGTQLRALQRRPQFIIGTPGRLKDLMLRRALRLDDCTNLVLDEADRVVDMGFIDDVRALIEPMPQNRQSLFFSATIMPEIRSLIDSFMKSPQTVSVKTGDTARNVDQDVIRFHDAFEKFKLLTDLLVKDECKKVLIFGRTKHGVEKLHENLQERGFHSVSIHGNKNQGQRQRALDSFKGSHVQIMVATDVAARGLDIPLVTHVINYDQPESYADYIHRIGRTGRAHHKGIALTFVG